MTDQHGDPMTVIEYKTSDNSAKLLDFHLDRATESMQAAGAAQTIRGSWIKESAFHHLGTVVMGDDPSTWTWGNRATRRRRIPGSIRTSCG